MQSRLYLPHRQLGALSTPSLFCPGANRQLSQLSINPNPSPEKGPQKPVRGCSQEPPLRGRQSLLNTESCGNVLSQCLTVPRNHVAPRGEPSVEVTFERGQKLLCWWPLQQPSPCLCCTNGGPCFQLHLQRDGSQLQTGVGMTEGFPSYNLCVHACERCVSV